MGKNIYLFVAPSGSGKTAVVESLEKRYGLKAIQSYTTRPPRYDVESGHTFVSDKEFDTLNDICALTEFCGYRYGATTEQVNMHDLYVIDPKGVEYFKEHYKGNKQIRVIYIYSTVEVRYERMKQRLMKKGETPETAIKESLLRIANDGHEFYDYIHNVKPKDFVVQNNFENTVDKVADEIYDYIKKMETKQ